MGTVFILLLVVSYFIPSIIALLNKKSNTGAIVVLNLFLGWSVVGWIVALVWAVSKDNKPQNIVISNNPNPQNIEKNEINHLDQLEKLKKLFDNEVISQEEYETQKSKILNN